MGRSFLPLVCLTFAGAMAGCFLVGSAPQTPAAPPAIVRTAALDITPGIKVLARHMMPDGFMPIAGRAPIWLQGGGEIGVIGARNGRIVVLGFGGPGWRDERIIAEDGGPGLRGLTIRDVAASPDGMTLALAAANPKKRQIAVVVRDLIAAADNGHTVASFDGVFETASVGWFDPFTIALVLGRPRLSPPNETAAPLDAAPAPNAPGLYAIAINGMVTVEAVKLGCPLSALSCSPRGRYAVSQGDAAAPPVLVDRETSLCRPLGAASPIRVLDWSRDGRSFLYVERGPAGVPVAYRYDLPAGPARVVAVSSSAAAFTATGDVLALGNSQLGLGRARRLPNAPVRAELGLLNPKENRLRTVSLGFKTTPTMMAESGMAYSPVSASTAVSALAAGPAGVFRKIIIYRLAERDAYVVASGPARGPVLMGWSPRGRRLAIVDAGPVHSVLTVLEPPL